MYLTDLVRQIIFSLWTHKVRTCLALFGIIWGTIAVILLLAIGNGFYAANIKNLAFLNNGTIFVWPGTTSKSYAGLPQGQKIHMQIKDLNDMMQHVPGIKTFSPVYFTERVLSYQDKDVQGSLSGVGASYGEIQQVAPLPGGRFINILDIKQKNRVAFLDDKLKTTLFGQQEALGKTLLIAGIPFTVIGVANSKHKGSIIWMSNSIYIPYTTFLALFGQQDINLVFLQPQSAQDAAHIKNNFKTILAMRYRFDPNDKQALMIPNTEEAQVFFKWFFRTIELFLGFCGALTLSVGGLGIANMMFLIVTERTREIGLRMALGAEQLHIMLQFMLETLLLVGIGGAIGFLISGCCISILQQLTLPEWLGTPHFSWLTVIVTISILTLVGMIAGYFPARRAANMEPVKALGF
jgi:putative ABC transport system permease protein